MKPRRRVGGVGADQKLSHFEWWLEWTPEPGQARRLVLRVTVRATSTKDLASVGNARSAIKFGLGLGEDATPLADGDGLVRVWPDRTCVDPFDIWLVTPGPPPYRADSGRY